MVADREPREPGPLRALGVAPGRLVGTGALFAVAGFGGCLAAGAGAGIAAGTAIALAGAVAATAWIVGAGLHRTVVVPVSACRRQLAEAAAGREPGPLPEVGAPLLRGLLHDANGATAALAVPSPAPAATRAKAPTPAAPAPAPAARPRLPAPVHDAARLLAEALRRAAPVLSRLGVRAELAAEGSGAVHCEGEDLIAVFARLCEAAAERSRAGGTLHAVVLGLPDHVEATIAEDRPGVRTLQRTSAGPDGPPPGCRTAVAALGGTLQQEDSPLGGQQFRVVLPAAALAAARG